MFWSTAILPVNPENTVPLNRAQVWDGLVLKTHDARVFLPPGFCTQWEIVDENATHTGRNTTIAGAGLREVISFDQRCKVPFFHATGPREGVIVNDLFEDDSGALQLKFYCYTGLRGKERTAVKSRPSRHG